MIVNQVGTYSVVYTAKDLNNHIVTEYRTVIVDDKTKPVITVLGDNPYIIEKNDQPYNDLSTSIYLI